MEVEANVPRSGARRWAGPALRLAATIAALGAIALVAALVRIRLSVPARSGRVRLPGLSAAVQVAFDRRGIPHLLAATELDACRALGWLHAGDRFLQMEFRRRAASGTLAEIVGPSLVPLDLRSRREGHRQAAQAEAASLTPRLRAMLEAYAAGVNAYLSARPRPVELVALGVEPEPWSLTDSLAFAHLMLTGLSDAPDREIRGLLARGTVESADGTRVLPTASGDRDQTLPREAGAAGSNAWAVSRARSASGGPILANDPHLRPEFPGVWYAAHLTTGDGLDVAGLTLPGIPGVAIGHNGRVAWGITVAQVDDADLYLELLDPAKRATLRDGRSLPLEERQETIRVKGQAERRVSFLRTERVSLLGGFREKDGTWKAVGLAFAAERARGSLEAFARAARAGSAQELQDAWASYRGPAFNVCWAAADGHTGLRLAGSVPRRRSTLVDGRGFSVEDWDGIVPDAELPRIVDPPEGFVASANDDWSAAGRKLPYPGDYATGDRVQRIRELLRDRDGVGVQDMNAIQNDILSPYAVRVVRGLSGIELPEGDARRARTILQTWDGRASRTGPSRLFFAFVSQLASREKLAGWAAVEAAVASPDPRRVGEILAASLREVEREDGADPEAWNWGRLHTLSYHHPFSGRLPWALRFLERWLDVGPLELPGEVHTVHVEGFRLGAEPRVRHIPSARLVVDLGNPDASSLVLPLGQSGQFQDIYYEDQVRAWAEGRTYPFPFTARAVDAAAVSVLRLEP